MLINLQFINYFLFILFLIRFVNSDCPPIHTILNGQIVAQPDTICLSRENSLDIIKCPPLNNPLNGFIIGICQPVLHFTCKFGCLNGLTLSHPNPLTCLSSGQWSSPAPICDNYPINDCDLNAVKTLFKNGFINCNQNEKSQLTCRFQCYNGYLLTGGSSILTCQSNGKFNGLLPTCVPIESTNSLVEYNHSPLTSPNLMIYSRPFNYFVTSNSIQCPQLSHLKSGSTNCDCSSGNIQFGCVCRFFCNENYYLIGSPMIQCTKFGNWSSVSPVCRRGSACPLPENFNKNVFLLHCDTSLNGKCLYRCKGSVYFIDSTGKINKNQLSLTKNMLQSDNKLTISTEPRSSKSSYDFTLKSNTCLLSGNWSTDFVCDTEEELNLLNKFNLSSGDEERVSATIFKRRRRRRRRRRPNRGRLVPMRLGPKPNRARIQRRPTRIKPKRSKKERVSLDD